MIILLRGHIRNAFTNKNLYTFIKNISDNNTKIYIHTWNIISSNLSWRPILHDDTIVSSKMI